MLVLDPAVHTARLQHTIKFKAPVFVDGREGIQIHMATAISCGWSSAWVDALLNSAVGQLDCRGFGDLRHGRARGRQRLGHRVAQLRAGGNSAIECSGEWRGRRLRRDGPARCRKWALVDS